MAQTQKFNWQLLVECVGRARRCYRECVADVGRDGRVDHTALLLDIEDALGDFDLLGLAAALERAFGAPAGMHEFLAAHRKNAPVDVAELYNAALAAVSRDPKFGTRALPSRAVMCAPLPFAYADVVSIAAACGWTLPLAVPSAPNGPAPVGSAVVRAMMNAFASGSVRPGRSCPDSEIDRALPAPSKTQSLAYAVTWAVCNQALITYNFARACGEYVWMRDPDAVRVLFTLNSLVAVVCRMLASGNGDAARALCAAVSAFVSRVQSLPHVASAITQACDTLQVTAQRRAPPEEVAPPSARPGPLRVRAMPDAFLLECERRETEYERQQLPRYQASRTRQAPARAH